MSHSQTRVSFLPVGDIAVVVIVVIAVVVVDSGGALLRKTSGPVRRCQDASNHVTSVMSSPVLTHPVAAKITPTTRRDRRRRNPATRALQHRSLTTRPKQN